MRPSMGTEWVHNNLFIIKTLFSGFVEKRLQYREADEMSNWCRLHSKDRILDVDFALSYGVFDVQINSTKTNCLEFVWNPNREASIFVKLNCISTEFTSKRHGGERGSPLRLIIETYSATNSSRLDGAQCLVLDPILTTLFNPNVWTSF